MKYLFYSFIPLAFLFILILIACLFSYLFLQVAGDLLPLHALISKGTQIFLILSIFPLRHYLALSWSSIGFTPKTVFFKQIFQGLGLGLLTLMPVLIVLYGLDVHIIDATRIWTLNKIFKHLFIALFLASLISFVEEPLFRGILLSGLRKKMPIIVAILVSSTYYAALHFLKNKTDIPYGEISFSSSFILLKGAFVNCLNPDILSAFIALLMVGIFLSVIRVQVKNSLGLCIGYHTSWVWQIKMSKDVFNTNYFSEHIYLVNAYDGVIGSLVSVWMAFVIAVYLGYQYWFKNSNN